MKKLMAVIGVLVVCGLLVALLAVPALAQAGGPGGGAQCSPWTWSWFQGWGGWYYQFYQWCWSPGFGWWQNWGGWGR
jgi:hypothetical protein